MNSLACVTTKSRRKSWRMQSEGLSEALRYHSSSLVRCCKTSSRRNFTIFPPTTGTLTRKELPPSLPMTCRKLRRSTSTWSTCRLLLSVMLRKHARYFRSTGKLKCTTLKENLFRVLTGTNRATDSRKKNTDQEEHF